MRCRRPGSAGGSPPSIPGSGSASSQSATGPWLNRLPELAILGQPLLIGASRKAFLGAALRSGDRVPPPAARDAATAAVSALAAAAGAYNVRANDVPATLDAVRVAAEWRRGLPARAARLVRSVRPARAAGAAHGTYPILVWRTVSVPLVHRGAIALEPLDGVEFAAAP